MHKINTRKILLFCIAMVALCGGGSLLLIETNAGYSKLDHVLGWLAVAWIIIIVLILIILFLSWIVRADKKSVTAPKK